MLVLSHGDNDHAGGAGAVRRAYAPAQVLSGEPARLGGAQACVGGTAWQWDGVHFEFLHPPAHFPELRNDSSCVLRVRAGHHRALLTGDISGLVEARLVAADTGLLATDVLVVPHHGSRSSSSAAFLAAARAPLALLSVAHRSRFGHPAPEVVARHADAGSALGSTAQLGAMTLLLGAEDPPAVRGFRHLHPRFWRER
jgi:competence protein ComEC